MPAGIIVYNDDGYVQITDAYKNFVLIGKGAVNLDGTAWTPGGGSFQYGSHASLSFPNVNGYPPVLALRCATHITLFRCRLVSGNWVFVFLSSLGTPRTDTIEYWAFGPTPNVTPSAAGFEVRTAAGELAYHSDYKPMNVKDFQSELIGSSGDFSIPSGRTIALALVSSVWAWSHQVPSGTWRQFMTGSGIITPAQNTGQHIRNLQYGQQYQPANFGWGGGTSGYWAVLALDVTGY